MRSYLCAPGRDQHRNHLAGWLRFRRVILVTYLVDNPNAQSGNHCVRVVFLASSVGNVLEA